MSTTMRPAFFHDEQLALLSLHDSQEAFKVVDAILVYWLPFAVVGVTKDTGTGLSRRVTCILVDKVPWARIAVHLATYAITCSIRTQTKQPALGTARTAHHLRRTDSVRLAVLDRELDVGTGSWSARLGP